MGKSVNVTGFIIHMMIFLLILTGIYGQKHKRECFKYRAPYTRGSCDNYKHVKSAVCKKVCQRRKDLMEDVNFFRTKEDCN
ncbi:hypothetical protein AtNW77_Chr2g0225191 [Arabidopsis thaliana]